MIYFLFAVVIVCVVGFVIAGVTQAVTSRSGMRSTELKAAKEQRTIGEKALRSIANGAASPVLEAQIALDEITALYDTKELT